MTGRILPNFLRCLVAAAVLAVTGSAAAGELPRPGEDLLAATYREGKSRLESNSFGLPLFLDSVAGDGRVQVDVYGIFDYPFGSVVAALVIPASWCDIVALHPNVKACTYQERAGAWLLTFFLGRKFYQPPEDTHQVLYQLQNVAQRAGYLDIVLSAEEGPYGTRDHLIRFQALPLGEGKTFAHIGYGYRDSVAIRLAEAGYFATLGSGKIGFTVTGADRDGQPVYIDGARGAIERNAVRYYFAIQSFMNTLHLPDESRFGLSSSDWYELADRYRKQLFELDKEDYLIYKAKEHEHQVRLQRSIVNE